MRDLNYTKTQFCPVQNYTEFLVKCNLNIFFLFSLFFSFPLFSQCIDGIFISAIHEKMLNYFIPFR